MRRLPYYAVNLWGFLIAWIIGAISVKIPSITGSYWAAVGVIATMLLTYFFIVHPRLRRVSGYEYAALYVGGVGAIALAGLIWTAITKSAAL